MSAPDLSLLTKRRFAPMFVVQFLGAFNDNLLKFAMLFLANFGIYANAPEKAEILAAAATGLFIAPYFLFSALAGQLADRIDKARLIRWIKLAEVLIMGIGLAGFWFQSIPALMTALFLMGLHSTIFGPVKYSILPQHLREHEIMGGTGLIEAGTFLAILGGQLLAGVVPPWEAGLIATGLACIGFLLWGIARKSRMWRIASLLMMIAAVAKVFLFDASGLDGLARIGSFVALGVSLIGVGWFYSRFLPDAQLTGPKHSGDSRSREAEGE